MMQLWHVLITAATSTWPHRLNDTLAPDAAPVCLAPLPGLVATAWPAQGCNAWYMHAVHKLDEQTALALQAAGVLEEQLGPRLPSSAGAPWCVRERIEPLLQGWVAHQLGLLRSWAQRILASEDWRPVTAPRGCSRCPACWLLAREESCVCLFVCGHVRVSVRVSSSARALCAHACE